MTAALSVIGSFMMDLTVYASRRPTLGETVIGEHFAMSIGGKGMNQAVAAVRAGANVAMIGVLGDDDFGDRFMVRMRDEGIDTSHVRREPDIGTGVGTPVVTPDGENSIVVVPRANNCFDLADIERARPQLERTDVLLAQFELPLAPITEATRIVRAAGGFVVLNAAPAQALPHEIEFDYLVVNRVEAAQLSSDGDTAPERLATALYTCLKPRGVLVTLGADGVILEDGRGPVHLDGQRVDPVDTVGAGDAFCGYLSTRLAEGATLEESALDALIAGALCVTRTGAADAMPTRSDVQEFSSALMKGVMPIGRRSHGPAVDAFPQSRVHLPGRDRPR